MLDGQLFLIRHLLILKDLVHKLDLVQQEMQKAVEPPGVTGMMILPLIAIKFNSQVRYVVHGKSLFFRGRPSQSSLLINRDWGVDRLLSITT